MAKIEMDDEAKAKKDEAVSQARISNLRSKGMSERDATIAGLVNMKRKDDDESPEVAPSKPEGPKYPYGLRFRLEDEDLSKLGIKELPEVNDVMKFTVEAKVDSVSSNQNSDGKSHECVEFQITDMQFLGEEEEHDEESETSEEPAEAYSTEDEEND